MSRFRREPGVAEAQRALEVWVVVVVVELPAVDPAKAKGVKPPKERRRAMLMMMVWWCIVALGRGGGEARRGVE